MDKRQLKAFICVFEERNITRAARQLSLTQPALSATIRALEEELGTPLFVRQTRGVEVTDDARALYPHARRMVSEMASLTDIFRKRRDKLPLHMGIEQDISRSLISELSARVHQELPMLLLNMEPGCTGSLRLGAESLRCEDELFIPLYDDRFVLAAGPQQELPATEPLDMESLHALAWVMCPQDASHQRLLPYYGYAANEPAASAGDFRLALDLVAAGYGCAIVPHSLALEYSSVHCRELPGYPLQRRTGICYAVAALADPAVVQLLDIFTGNQHHSDGE
ncbi:LysR family transcriptional regulator [Salmonella enterica subsp. enterica serovar Choleraesuis]|nr:LysR family transcriptional regulator [Salmonella enterica subsp. enterica serovar Choleraesuis]